MGQTFKLRFPANRVRDIADRYSYPGEDHIVKHLAPQARERGFFDRKAFLQVCYWKTPRTRTRCDKNSDELIENVTRIALSTPCEELRIKILLVLDGVSWPTASVILHFGYDNLYPILDYRALWSVGITTPPPYTFEFWKGYTKFCRDVARRLDVTMRVLDRALWQNAKEHQPYVKRLVEKPGAQP